MSIETEVVQLEPAPVAEDPSLDRMRELGEKIRAYGLVSREDAEQLLANGGQLPATASLESFTAHLSYTNVRPALESVVGTVIAKIKALWARFVAWLGRVWKTITNFWNDVKSKHRRDKEAHLRHAKMAELIGASREFIRRVKLTVDPARVNKVCVAIRATPSGWMNASPELLTRFYPTAETVRSMRDAFIDACGELSPSTLGTDQATLVERVKSIDTRVREVVFNGLGIHASNRDNSSKVAMALAMARAELEVDDGSVERMEPEAILTALERKFLDLSRAEVFAEGLMSPELKGAYEKLNADWTNIVNSGDPAAVDASAAVLRAATGLVQMMASVDAHLVYGYNLVNRINHLIRSTAEDLLKAYPKKAAGQDSVDMLVKALRESPAASGSRAPVISINVSP